LFKFRVFCPAIPTFSHRLRQAAKTLTATGGQRILQARTERIRQRLEKLKLNET